MAYKFLVAVDLTGKQLLNFRLQNLASDPSPFGKGHAYFNTTTDKPRISLDGTTFVDFGGGNGSTAWGDITGRPAHLTGTINTAEQVVVLDSGGLIPESLLPDLAISEFLGEVANESAMLALTGQRGDWCVRTDLEKVFIAIADDTSLIGSWRKLEYPAPPPPSWDDVTDKPTTFAPRKFEQTIGNGSLTQITVTHNFGTRAFAWDVREAAGNQESVLCNLDRPTVDTARLSFASAPASNSLIVTIIG